MTKWHEYCDSWGNNRAFYDAIHNGDRITGNIADCDGDFVIFQIAVNNEEVAIGSVYPKDGPNHGRTNDDEIWAWEEAKRLANIAISTKR